MIVIVFTGVCYDRKTDRRRRRRVDISSHSRWPAAAAADVGALPAPVTRWHLHLCGTLSPPPPVPPLSPSGARDRTDGDGAPPRARYPLNADAARAQQSSRARSAEHTRAFAITRPTRSRTSVSSVHSRDALPAPGSNLPSVSSFGCSRRSSNSGQRSVGCDRVTAIGRPVHQWVRLVARDRIVHRDATRGGAGRGGDGGECVPRPVDAPRVMRSPATAMTAAVAVLACCRPQTSAARAACLHTAKDLQAQARASEVVLKALAMSVWPEPDGLVGGHFAVMTVYKGARTVKDVLRIGGADLFNLHDKWVRTLFVLVPTNPFCPRDPIVFVVHPGMAESHCFWMSQTRFVLATVHRVIETETLGMRTERADGVRLKSILFLLENLWPTGPPGDRKRSLIVCPGVFGRCDRFAYKPRGNPLAPCSWSITKWRAVDNDCHTPFRQQFVILLRAFPSIRGFARFVAHRSVPFTKSARHWGRTDS